jgi:hypothetical protein
MKKYMLLLLLLAGLINSNAQTEGNAKIYGYQQQVLPGANNNVVVEGGGETTAQNTPRKNYKIYIVSASRIYPVEMWINGTQYSVKMDIISSTPVMHGNEAAGNRKELVPKTSQKVLLLTPASYTEKKNVGDVRSIAQENELVVLYKQNGRFYYNSLKNLEQLDAAAMQ